MKTANIYEEEIGNMTYLVSPLQSHKREIMQYAEAIASLDPGFWNQYVMAFDYTDDPLWVVNPGDADLKDIISWNGVKRIEIWDYSTEVNEEGRNVLAHGNESMYYATGRALDQYIASRGLMPERTTNNK